MADKQLQDPSIFLYDEVYDQFKAETHSKVQQQPTAHQKKKLVDNDDDKYIIPKSKHIAKMKGLVKERQQQYKQALTLKQQREAAKDGRQVFVSESYRKQQLIAEQERKQRLQKDKQEEMHQTAIKKQAFAFRSKCIEQQMKLKKGQF